MIEETLAAVYMDATFNGITKFKPEDVTEQRRGFATDYGMFYEGEFPFMLDIAAKMQKNDSLSDAQIAGVLNCIFREAKTVIKDKEAEETPKPAFSLNIPSAGETEIKPFNIETDTEPYFPVDENSPAPITGTVVDTKSGDVYIVEDQTVAPDLSALPAVTEIEQMMEELQKKITSIENSDAVSSLELAMEQSKKEEKELYEAFEATIADLREKRKTQLIEMNGMIGQVNAAKEELKLLGLKHNDAIKNAAVLMKLQEIEDRLMELRADAPWKDLIRDFQWEDVCTIIAAFLDGKNGVLNANDMGLGKTAESVFVLYFLKTLFPEKYGYAPKILWLTKKSLMSSSIKEFRKWDPDVTPIPVTGNPDQRKFIVELAINAGQPVIVNYDALNTTPLLMDTKWDIIVMDEVHKLKGGSNSNPTKVWENAVAVCQRAKFIMPLSGSPIQNHPKEMWSYLYMLEPDRFPNVRDFTSRFCWGYDEGLTVNWDRLIKILSNRVIRRSKAEVLKDLPDKTREFRYIEMGTEQRRIYNSLKDEFFVWLDDQKTEALTATSILAQLTRLRQVALMPGSIKVGDKNIECTEACKLDEAMDIIDQLVNTGEQVVVFSSQFNEPLFELKRRIEKEFKVTCETITGANSIDSVNIEDRFRDGTTRVLLANMKSGGEGLNLQTASHAIFLDLWYNPKSNEQAEDRLHRQGQKNAVTIHVMQAEDSVDAFIAAILDKKEGMIEGIMEDNSLRGGKDWKSFLQDVL